MELIVQHGANPRPYLVENLQLSVRNILTFLLLHGTNFDQVTGHMAVYLGDVLTRHYGNVIIYIPLCKAWMEHHVATRIHQKTCCSSGILAAKSELIFDQNIEIRER